MFIILGASGHVGSAAVDALLAEGSPVTAVVHRAEQETAWRDRGAEVVTVDVHDSDALRAVFRSGTRAFLLNPPAPTDKDTEVEEQATRRSIVSALDGSGLEKVVLESTYGAQPGERCGDLNILYDFEQALARQSIPATIQRAAYYMSNWDDLLDAARGGELPTMFPADLRIPMVAPRDLGRAAAKRLQEPPASDDLHYVEGPERYTPQDVADAFAEVLGLTVEVVTTPRDQWIAAYRKLGFSEPAAQSYAKMTAVSLDSGFYMPDAPERGTTSLQEYVSSLVENASKAPKHETV